MLREFKDALCGSASGSLFIPPLIGRFGSHEPAVAASKSPSSPKA